MPLLGLCSTNSINIARVLVQAAHHAFVHFKTGATEIVIPTGACGNVAGGIIAKQLGIPLTFVAAVSENDIVHRAFSHGLYATTSDVKKTWASAIDIQVPYNVERILLIASGYNFKLVAEFMKDFEEKGKSKIDSETLRVIQTFITGTGIADNDEITKTIKKVYKERSYLICPHTAVAINYHLRTKEALKRVCISTASPEKFPEAISAAGIKMDSMRLEGLMQKPTKFEWMRKGQDWEAILRKKIQSLRK